MAGAYRPSLNNMIHLQRAYDEPITAGGRRFLVDRLWSQGIKKDDLALDGWFKDIAPSDELRRWFAHDPQKWLVFQQRYRDELDAKPESWQPLLAAAGEGDITLVYGARDREHNDAVVLKAYLEEQIIP